MKKTYEIVAWRIVETRYEFEIDPVLYEDGTVDADATAEAADEYAHAEGYVEALFDNPLDEGWYTLDGGHEIREV